MNLNLVKINVLLLILVLESQGGLIDGVVDRFTNTKDGLKQDLKNVWSYSKHLVGQETAGDEKEERGLIGGLMHSAHEKIHSLRDRLWTVDDIPNDSGLLWGMYNRFTLRLSKAKHFILGDDAKLFNDTIHQLYHPNGTIKVGDETFKESVVNLQEAISETYKTGTNATSVNFGEGLIDFRLGDISRDFQENTASVVNDMKDKVDDNMNAVKDTQLRQNANNGMETVKKGLNQVGDEAIALKDTVVDAAAKEEDLLSIAGNKLSKQAKNVDDSVKKAADDIKRY